LEAVSPAEFLAESLDSPGGVDEFLLAGEKGMACTANIDRQSRPSAAGRKVISASAMHGTGLVTGMDLLSHDNTPLARSCAVAIGISVSRAILLR
jgi:hypothetical protein